MKGGKEGSSKVKGLRSWRGRKEKQEEKSR